MDGGILPNLPTDTTMDGGTPPNLPTDTTMDGGISQHAHQQKNLFRNPRGTLPLGVKTGIVAVYRVQLDIRGGRRGGNLEKNTTITM